MGQYLRFEDLEVWKEAMRVCIEIYELLKDCKDYGMKDQMQRSAVSIPSNIAEGYERKGSKETTQFLYFSKGSCGELRTQLYLAIHLQYVDKDKGNELIDRLLLLSRKIYKFIQSIN